jgi:PAT family beta-lactamase induction signal transducer AmpG
MLKKIFSYRMMMTLFLGYSSGFPLLLIGSTLQAWMKNVGVDLAAIGAFSLVGLPYTLKFLWAPLLDRFNFPLLGRRRGWMIVFQLFLVLSIYSLTLVDPRTNLFLVAIISFVIAFFSASQDIVLDAYRREILPDEELGLGSSMYVNGYRIAMIVSGAYALYLADQMPWENVYKWMSILMLPSLLFTLLAPSENELVSSHPKNLKEAIWGPLSDFFSRRGSLIILSFILFYKVGDSMASNMTTPFILDIGYSKTDLASVAKTFGMAATIIGGLIGGALMLKIEIKKSLVIFGILQCVSTLGFAFLPHLPLSVMSLALIIALENLASGMGTASYAGYMASLTNKQFTATQYALLSALMGVPRVILASPTGIMSKYMGWEIFFIFCTFMAIPGLLLLRFVFGLEKPIPKSAI